MKTVLTDLSAKWREPRTNSIGLSDETMQVAHSVYEDCARQLEESLAAFPIAVTREEERYREIAKALRKIHNEEEHFPMLIVAAETIDKLLDDIRFSLTLTRHADERAVRMMALLEKR